MSAGRSGAPRPITRNLAGEFDEVAKPEPARDDSGSDNEVSGKKPADESVIRKLPGNRTPMNSSTPAADRVIGRILDQMMESSDWIGQFTPKAVRQAPWVEQSGELTWPVNTMSAVKVAEDTVSLLSAMGLEPQTNPSEGAPRDWPPAIAGKELKRWKRKLRLSFGTSDIGLQTPPTVRPKGDADPSQIPLPQTPKKNEHGMESDDDRMFGVKTEGTPYFQDSHMVTPRSSNRAHRLARDIEASNAKRGNARASSGRSRRRFVPRDDSSDDDSGDDDYYRKEDAEYDDPSDELARQVREVSEMERLNSTPRLELATHRPLAQIKSFSGLRDKSEQSMQWLRTFVYEMKATRTLPNEWCMAFGLSLRDGALHWGGYRRDRYDRHGRGCDRWMDDSRHTPRISLAEASLSEMMAELQVRESKYWRSERSKSRDMRRRLEDSNNDVVEGRATDDDQSGSDYTDAYHSDEHNRHVAAANDAERRTEAIGTYGRSENRGLRGASLTEGSTATPATKALTDVAVSMDRVQHAGELTIPSTTVSSVRNGSFAGGESDERRNDEWNGGSSEGLVPSVTQNNWHDYQPENVIKLLSGERLGWWSAQMFDKRARMRALVQGAGNDARTRILLDTGANVSVISERFAKQLRVLEVRGHGQCMEIHGFTKGTTATTKRALAKVTLGWKQVYDYELWVMDHGAGVDGVLGTDFIIPAGVRLDLFHATAQLPDEAEIPLIKTQRMADTREESPHVPDGPTEVLTIPGHESRDYRPMRQPPTKVTHALWVRRTKELIPKVVEFRRGRPRRVRVTNISDRLVTCPVHLPLLLWVPRGDLPRTEGYVRLGSDKYNEWRVLAYSRSRDSDLYKVGGEIYQRWLAALPSAVERVPYTTPTKILRRPSESSEGSLSDREDQVECATDTTEPSTELLKGLLKAGLIAFSDSPWASPIVIVLKKNGVGIRFCNDYKMVNAVTAIMEYAMPLVDDLLTDMEKYLWYCSVDAAGGFWAVMMTQRARKISAFVCALGHFEWLRMPFGLKNAPMIYQRMIDNALWGFGQPRGGWSAFAERVRMDEAADTVVGGSPTDTATHSRTRFEADRESSDITDSLSAVANDPRGDMFVSGEADQSSPFAVKLSTWHLVVHRVNEDDSAFAQLLHPTITNFVRLDEALQRVAPPSKRTSMVRMDPALLYARLPNDHRGFVLSFDGSAKTPKHGGYGNCVWILWRLPDWKIEIAASAYLESTTVNQAEYMDMNEGLRAAQAYGVTDLVVVGDSRLAIQSLHVTREYNASMDSLAGETLPAKEAKTTLTEESKSKLEQLNRIHEVIYERPNREVTQVSTLRTLSEDMATQRDNVFDFALKPMFIMAITTQQTQTAKKQVRFADTHDEDSEALPVEPEPSDRPNDVTTESSHVENGETSPGAAERPPSAEDVDPLELQEERHRRVGRAQDEELRWANLKLVLKGDSSSLGYKAAGEAWKMADRFVLSDDGLLYFLGEDRRWGKDRMNETVLRLVVPTTMVQEVLQSCHDSLEGGHQGIVRTFHRVKADNYWIILYADVERYVRSRPDCSSSKSRHQLREYSPGNILAEPPLQIVSMDFVIPLPKSRRGNTALLLFQCEFTGFVTAKAMLDTSALYVAQAFAKCVYRRFGSPSLVRHDRDPRFTSEVFQAFAEMMQSRPRATLSYRRNGQQERSVKTVM
ncbi:unnamed protein product [Phytophthora fragariaefolia]|uniref:Unnamed protein product n=1 Tax=Phytophthora fragariaefolia TaxID=1490495 RepID=A0A9W7CXM4_9STRA|nr:unnamed protein product [Phytophthora fragariaefolia]